MSSWGVVGDVLVGYRAAEGSVVAGGGPFVVVVVAAGDGGICMCVGSGRGPAADVASPECAAQAPNPQKENYDRGSRVGRSWVAWVARGSLILVFVQ